MYEGYEQLKTKIMLVGAETSGWYPLLKRNEQGQALTKSGAIAKFKKARAKDNLPAESLKYETLEDYIDKTMQRHRQVMKFGTFSRNTKGHTFYNYLRNLNKILEPVGVGYKSNGWVWSNLHCFDWSNKTPIKNIELYRTFIKPLSKKLIDAQIEALKPDFIVFLCGKTAGKTLREFFPFDGTNKRREAIEQKAQAFAPKFLRQFILDSKINCLQTYHPGCQA